MEKVFSSSEEIIADERFAGWYFKTGDEQRREWESYVLAHPEILPLIEEAVLLLGKLQREKDVPETQVEAATQRLLYRVQNPGSDPVVRRMRISRRSWIAAAAVIVVMLTGAGWWWYTNRPESVQAAYGEIVEKVLPDGTKVLLNANSKISYACTWNEETEREVWLKGEAFFHVKKTASKSRFVVHANQFDIIVTGTQFNVISKEHTNSVMLTEGSVTLVTKDGQKIYMVPGDFAELDNGILKKTVAQDESILAWRDRKIVFSGIPLRSAIHLIEEHYGITVKLKDSALGDKLMKGVLPVDNLDIMLESLETAFKLKATRQGDVVTITGY
ncbi:MAG: FecR domain-containing protein [Chitinophagaceae bacterium]